MDGWTRPPIKPPTLEDLSHQYGIGTHDDPGPIRLGWEWLSGSGPENRVLDPSTHFSQRFRQGPAALAFENFVLRKYNGTPPDGGTVTNFDWPFKFGRALSTGNLPQHFVGSVQDGNAFIENGVAHFSVRNNSNTTSLAYGRALEEKGIPSVPSYSRSSFGPGGNTHQIIQWSTPVGRLGRVP